MLQKNLLIVQDFIKKLPEFQKILVGLVVIDAVIVGMVWGFVPRGDEAPDGPDEVAPSLQVQQEVTLTISPTQSVVPTEEKSAVSVPTLTPSAKVITIAPTAVPKDTKAPEGISFVGLDDGRELPYNSGCFAVRVFDDVSSFSSLVARFKLDSNEWTAWSSDQGYCISNLGDGPHSLTVEERDEAGNVASSTRNFTVKKI